MASRIPEQFIDQLVSRVDIVDVIGSRIQLKKAGQNYQACCPFHNEKTPSFVVSPNKQIYKCFGCGVSGSAIKFLMEYDNMEFREVIEELAKSAGMELPDLQQGYTKPKVSSDLYEITEFCSKFFQKSLRDNGGQNNGGQNNGSENIAVHYLKQRDVSGEVAARFAIGYAPPGWDNITSQLRSQQKELIECGMAIEKESGGCYDRFRDRLMFPIRDRRGRTIAFGGRVMNDELPKYLNSPETPIFHKGRELYGLYEAIQHSRHLENILVVEGYMDVVALAQFDINNAVATLGTSTSKDHIERIFKHTEEVVFCFDGDKAGKAAAWRALENTLFAMQKGRQAKFLFVDEGDDPDTMVRRIGTEQFKALIKSAQPLSHFLFYTLLTDCDIGTLDGRSRFLEKCKPLLQQIPKGSYLDLLLEELSKLTHLKLGDADKLKSLLFSSGKKQDSQPVKAKSVGNDQQKSPIRSAIAFMMHKPSLAAYITDPDIYQSLNLPGGDLFVEMIKYLHANPNAHMGLILEHWRGSEYGSALAKLATFDHMIPDEGIEAEFNGTLGQLNSALATYEITMLERKMHQGDITLEEQQRWQQLISQR